VRRPVATFVGRRRSPVPVGLAGRTRTTPNPDASARGRWPSRALPAVVQTAVPAAPLALATAADLLQGPAAVPAPFVTAVRACRSRRFGPRHRRRSGPRRCRGLRRPSLRADPVPGRAIFLRPYAAAVNHAAEEAGRPPGSPALSSLLPRNDPVTTWSGGHPAGLGAVIGAGPEQPDDVEQFVAAGGPRSPHHPGRRCSFSCSQPTWDRKGVGRGRRSAGSGQHVPGRSRMTSSKWPSPDLRAECPAGCELELQAPCSVGECAAFELEL